jgi:Mrp family chromosome partitioning ATPase
VDKPARERQRIMIIALLNQKGGVGKTTLATHIAGELAMQGNSVRSVWQEKRCIRKRRNSPGAATTSSSTVRLGLPPSRAPRCARLTSC